MSRLTTLRSQLNKRGKSVINYSADLLEWSAEKGLTVAGDIASFAVAQIRLPIEVQDFAEYRAEVQGSVAGFGETLLEHGQDYVAKLKDLPEDFRKAVNPGPKKPRKTTAKKRATKNAAVKKTVTKTATKKAAVKKAA